MNTEKKFDKFFVANLKRTAQMVSPMVKEKQKLMAEVNAKNMRIAALDAQIESLDGHVRRETGYGVEDLIVREVVNTGKVDKEGRPIKMTKWNLRYPETIVPPTEEAQPAEIPAEETISPEPLRPIE